MSNRLLLAIIILFGLSLLTACPAARRGGGGGSDDDDSGPADDDDGAEDDDDTTQEDDDDTTPPPDDDDATDDDDAGDDDDATGQPIATGDYLRQFDWGSALEEDAGWPDCDLVFDIDPASQAPEPGCPGCFVAFRVDFDWNYHTCGTGPFEDDPSDMTGVNFGVSGNVLWAYNYELGDWQTWMTGSSTSSSFSGYTDWYDEEAGVGYPYQWREAIDLEWF